MIKQCSNCGNFTWNNGFTPMPYICVDCKFIEVGDDAEPCNWKPKPITNADRIRAMSDEELCEFLYSYKFCDMCEEGCEECRYYGDCESRLTDWLQQPCEGGADDA